jgi:hypothetical protein
VVDDVDDEIGTHPAVLVDNYVARPCDRRPGNVEHGVAGLGRERSHRLPHDSKGAEQGVLRHQSELVRAEVLLVALASIDGVEDVGEPLFVGADHTATESARALAETSTRRSEASHHVHADFEKFAHLLCDTGDSKKFVASARQEVDQKVDVALRGRIAAGH